MFIELHIITTPQHVDALSDELTSLGALAITLQDAADQPIYEPDAQHPRLWDQTTVVALFAQDQAIDPIIEKLNILKTQGLFSHFQTIEIADEDWVRRSLDSFKPISFGKRLWICPSWHTPPNPHAINVLLDPGLAFGTGTHPTTALCLEWLDEHVTPGLDVIDYGCGSGILAIAACKLGAKKVLAVDHDPQALTATRANAAQNSIYPTDLTTVFPSDVPKDPADIVIANILAKPLRELAPLLSKLTKMGGKIALSGILNEQADEISQIYSAYFTLHLTKFSAEWCLVSGVKTK